MNFDVGFAYALSFNDSESSWCDVCYYVGSVQGFHVFFDAHAWNEGQVIAYSFDSVGFFESVSLSSEYERTDCFDDYVYDDLVEYLGVE